MKSSYGTRLERAMAEFRRVPGVVGIGSAFKTSADGATVAPALAIIVARKRPLDQVPPGERLPSSFEGVPVVVRERCPSVAAASDVSVLVGGASLQGNSREEGTLGCIAQAGSDTVLLTAGHVLTDDRGVIGPGGSVGSPNLSCCKPCLTGEVATILRGRIDDQFDCAIAKLTGAKPPQQRIPGLGGDKNDANDDLILGPAPLRLDPTTQIMSPVLIGERVRKVGVSTHLTGGDVELLDVPIPADPEAALPVMVPQIVIKPRQDEGYVGSSETHNIHFCLPGDSGSVVVDDNNQIVGLLIRKADFRDEPGKPRPEWEGGGGIATDIHKVMSALGITIPSSNVSRPTREARALRPGSKLVRYPALTPESSEQRAALERLKDELRQFARGRRLVEFIENHQPEITELVNHCRRVTVIWHRVHGPAFVALLLRGLRNLEQPIPRRVGSSSAEDVFVAMRSALEANGSDELVVDMRALWPSVFPLVPRSDTLRSVVDNLRTADSHV